jgi:hypothetical protein
MPYIPLPCGLSALVDDEDYQRLKDHKYFIQGDNRHLYACRRTIINGRRKQIYLHYDVLQISRRIPGMCIDHIDNNTLNCRRSNLRLITICQNAQRRRPPRGCSSKYKGISYRRERSHRRRPWRACIKVNGKQISRSFADEFSAVKWYNVMAYRLCGKFCYLNNWNGPTEREKDKF